MATSDVKGAGTDANVYVQLWGEHGDSGKRKLAKSLTYRDKFERNHEDIFQFEVCRGAMSLHTGLCSYAIQRSLYSADNGFAHRRRSIWETSATSELSMTIRRCSRTSGTLTMCELAFWVMVLMPTDPATRRSFSDVESI